MASDSVGTPTPTAGAPASTPAPTKGSPSPSATVAPGASGGTPSPETAATGQTAPPKVPWGEGKLRVPLKYEGKEEAAEFGTMEELQRELQLARLAKESRKQAAAHEARMKSLEAAAAESPEALMKALGIDFDGLFKSRLEREIQSSQMTEEQRRIEAAESARTAAERKAQQAESQLRARLQAEQEQRVWAEMEPKFRTAMDAAGMIGDDASMEEVASVAMEFNEAGLGISPEDVVREAAARQRERFDKRLAGFTVEDWERRIPEAMRFELSKRFVAQVQARRANGGQPPPAPKPPKSESSVSGYLDEYEARRKGLL